jgi:hypothetical protein
MLVVLLRACQHDRATFSPSITTPGSRTAAAPSDSTAARRSRLRGARPTTTRAAPRAARNRACRTAHPNEVGVLRDLYKSISLDSNMFESSMLHEDCGISRPSLSSEAW